MQQGLNIAGPNTATLCRNDEMDIIINILEIYNPRISEILSLTKKQVIPGKFAFLQGLKGSQDIIIRDRGILTSLEALLKDRQDKVFVYTSYYNVYSYIKKFMSHIVNQVGHKKNLHVTHAFRYLNVRGGMEDKTIKAVLHHNSVRSNRYYTNH
jgi:hypothetical protein